MENSKIIKSYQTDKESQYFDRKSARIDPKEIAKLISAYANADGGTIVLGIEDNGVITGFKTTNSKAIDSFKRTSFTFLNSHPQTEFEEIDCININNESDKLLIIKVECETNNIIQMTNDDVYLRVGDQSKKLTHLDIERLKYDKGASHFEEIINPRGSINDLNMGLVEEYCKLLKFDKEFSNPISVLESRHLLVNSKPTNACLLLFAKDLTKFCPNYGIRFIKYEGLFAETGERLNIIRDELFEGPLPILIDKCINFVQSQLRFFNSLDIKTNTFLTIPEYPEAAWVEGIINAVTHRDYSILGDQIKIFMFDDRIEIRSPGKLPNIVNLENMKNTRYSRNPRVARVLNDFGKVKELNEGVKRMYEEMHRFSLNEPKYSEPYNNSVLLILENNIIIRKLRKADVIMKIIEEYQGIVTEEEKLILIALTNKMKITIKESCELINRSPKYTRSLLMNLVNLEILNWNRTSQKDPKQYYTLKLISEKSSSRTE